MKPCFIANHLVSFLCGMCSRLDEQETLFARVQKSTCAKVAYVMFKEKNWDLGINSVLADPINIPDKINHAKHIKYQQIFVGVCDFASAKSIAFHLIHSIHSLTLLIPT